VTSVALSLPPKTDLCCEANKGDTSPKKKALLVSEAKIKIGISLKNGVLPLQCKNMKPRSTFVGKGTFFPFYFFTVL